MIVSCGTPKVHTRMKNTKEIRIPCPFPDSGIRALGLWAQNQDWHQVLDTNGTLDQAWLMNAPLY